MSLTSEDLKQIKIVVNDVVDDRIKGLATKSDLDRFATKADLDRFATKADLDRMETRLVTSINLLQRDSFTRLDDHEVRIARLEART